MSIKFLLTLLTIGAIFAQIGTVMDSVIESVIIMQSGTYTGNPRSAETIN